MINDEFIHSIRTQICSRQLQKHCCKTWKININQKLGLLNFNASPLVFDQSHRLEVYCSNAVNITNIFMFLELLSNNSVLFISSLQRSDAGIYSCEASNIHGTDMYEIMIEPKCKYQYTRFDLVTGQIILLEKEEMLVIFFLHLYKCTFICDCYRLPIWATPPEDS